MPTDETARPAVVLVVEDEPLLLMLALSTVEDAGFEAVVARNADQAIAILMARTDVRIIFTDIDMPGSMDGLRLAAAVRDRWPPIEIIVTSGKRVVDEAQLPARSRFFAKPYDAEQIAATMQLMAA